MGILRSQQIRRPLPTWHVSTDGSQGTIGELQIFDKNFEATLNAVSLRGILNICGHKCYILSA